MVLTDTRPSAVRSNKQPVCHPPTPFPPEPGGSIALQDVSTLSFARALRPHITELRTPTHSLACPQTRAEDVHLDDAQRGRVRCAENPPGVVRGRRRRKNGPISDNAPLSVIAAGPSCVIFGGEWPETLSAIWHDIREPEALLSRSMVVGTWARLLAPRSPARLSEREAGWVPPAQRVRVVGVSVPTTVPFLPAVTSSAPMRCHLACLAVEEPQVGWPHWCHLPRFCTPAPGPIGTAGR